MHCATTLVSLSFVSMPISCHMLFKETMNFHHQDPFKAKFIARGGTARDYTWDRDRSVLSNVRERRYLDRGLVEPCSTWGGWDSTPEVTIVHTSLKAPWARSVAVR